MLGRAFITWYRKESVSTLILMCCVMAYHFLSGGLERFKYLYDTILCFLIPPPTFANSLWLR